VLVLPSNSICCTEPRLSHSCGTYVLHVLSCLLFLQWKTWCGGPWGSASHRLLLQVPALHWWAPVGTLSVLWVPRQVLSTMLRPSTIPVSTACLRGASQWPKTCPPTSSNAHYLLPVSTPMLPAQSVNSYDATTHGQKVTELLLHSTKGKREGLEMAWGY
jgi:hypothetical protein